MYLELGKDPVNDYGENAPTLILLSLHPSDVCMYLVLGKDPVNDYLDHAPPLILLSLHPSEVYVYLVLGKDPVNDYMERMQIHSSSYQCTLCPNL